MSDPESQLARLRVALAANSLDTNGTLEECLDRLLKSRSGKKKRKRDDSTPHAVISATQNNIIALLKNGSLRTERPVRSSRVDK